MDNNSEHNLGVLVRKLEQDYISGQITSSKYVTVYPSEDVNKIYAYLDSKHTSGEQDSLGRDKPFFNISIAARNIWFRATDIDRKNILIKATKTGDVIGAFLASVHVQDWMKRENFGQFLNNWGINSAGFNESIIKFVEKDSRLIPSVTPWNKIICDFVDFANNPKIELLELTEAQLRQNESYDQEMVDKLCDAKKARETIDKRRKDNKSHYIKLYEVHGEFSQAVYKKSKGLEVKESDKDIYFQQMHVITFVETKKRGEYQDFTLYSGKEDDPYMLTALLPEIDGSIGLKGAVKNLFDAQWMTNHTAKSIKDQLDLASKLIFQTADGNFVGQNALTAIETGDILIHAVNQPLTKVNNSSHDIVQTQNYNSMWKSLGNEINGISESMMGINPPSGTAWRQTEALLGESHSLFKVMTQNKQLAIEEMMRRKVIPFIKRKMNTSDEIAATLDMHGIKQIEDKYIKNETVRRTNKSKKQSILNGTPVTPEMEAQMMQDAQQGVQGELSDMGGQRFFKPSEISTITWKKVLKDLEWEVEVEVGPDPESVDTNAMLTTLNTALQTVVNPDFANNPRAQFIVDKILIETGKISPMELASLPQPAPMQPAGGGSTELAIK